MSFPPLYHHSMRQLLKHYRFILMEAAVVEQLRRNPDIRLHPQLIHGPLIYESKGRQALLQLFRSYMQIAIANNIPFIMCAPTWRANYQRIKQNPDMTKLNEDAVVFMQDLKRQYGAADTIIKIGGLIGCKNDCYRPDEGLAGQEAERFHSWQIARLADSSVDFLIAETLPKVEEACGIARAMSKTGVPYIISFVINRRGRVLDGTELVKAIRIVDDATAGSALGYMVNCAHPTFLNADKQPAALFQRLIGYQANASTLDQCNLEGSEVLQKDDIKRWGAEMLNLN